MWPNRRIYLESRAISFASVTPSNTMGGAFRRPLLAFGSVFGVSAMRTRAGNKMVHVEWRTRQLCAHTRRATAFYV